MKELKRYNMHHCVETIEAMDRLVDFLNDNVKGEKVRRSHIIREAEQNVVDNYKRKYKKFAKSEKLRGEK